jgi:hypothetical protein
VERGSAAAVVLVGTATEGAGMIVHLAHGEGDDNVLERIDEPVLFEGGQPQIGVLVSFPFRGREVTARIVGILPPEPNGEPIIEVELIDKQALDAQSEITLARLLPKDDFRTDI